MKAPKTDTRSLTARFAAGLSRLTRTVVDHSEVPQPGLAKVSHDLAVFAVGRADQDELKAKDARVAARTRTMECVTRVLDEALADPRAQRLMKLAGEGEAFLLKSPRDTSRTPFQMSFAVGRDGFVLVRQEVVSTLLRPVTEEELLGPLYGDSGLCSDESTRGPNISVLRDNMKGLLTDLELFERGDTSALLARRKTHESSSWGDATRDPGADYPF